MKNVALPIVLVLISCTSSQPTESSQAEQGIDTTTTTKSIAPIATSVDERQKAIIDTVLTDADTLFNALAMMGAVHGTFVDIALVTENFIDVNDLDNARALKAYLIHSGEGDYGGINSDIQFQDIYTVLAVFEEIEGELNYFTHSEVSISSSGGLIVSSTEADELQLADGKFGVLVHNKSSEEGAGDSGFRRDEAELFVLIGGKIESVFQETLDDFSFASNETDSYGEQTTTVELVVLESKTKGLFDLQTTKSTSGNSWTEGEEEGSESAEEESESEEPAEEDDGIDVYRWSGTAYEISD